ncbi:hypothetical protein Ocin01_05750 [Orchesella cincta]|uniref:Uncharacterized protein n=1 Tax=Orchesella cincta TaxID=48709 RepID=A0A1D2N7I5_ORCCI|nr:hypothetical protein Ocin01_05750 [Orchesella cincta]
MFISTDSYLLPVAVPVIAVAIIAVVILAIKRSRTSTIRHEEMYSQFIPPIIGPNVPKEQTYIVPRNWKPPSSSVYAPLSVPIHQQRANIFSLPNIRNSELATRGMSLIHALPPSKESSAGISPEFV